MNKHWIAAWGCPIAKPARKETGWMKDVTVRFDMLMTVSGEALRFHFSNLFGRVPATVTAATVALHTDTCKVDTTRMAEITFKGKQSGTMDPAGEMSSDEIPFVFKAGETLSVSLYFGELTELTTAHENSGTFIEKWVSAGDQTHNGEFPVNENAEARAYPFIHTVDALCEARCYSIIAFGDSITAQTWPDRLSRRLLALGRDDVAVVRKAISGGRVLREYPCTKYQTYGPAGLDRFSREVLQAGVKKVFILHGINDIIHPDGSPFRPVEHQPTPEELIAGLKEYVDIAHKAGIEVYASPILPFKGWRTYSEEKNAIKEAVNRWIRNEAELEGVLPFADALADPADPLALQDIYDSGDHLHPRSAGAQAMADSIPEEML